MFKVKKTAILAISILLVGQNSFGDYKKAKKYIRETYISKATNQIQKLEIDMRDALQWNNKNKYKKLLKQRNELIEAQTEFAKKVCQDEGIREFYPYETRPWNSLNIFLGAAATVTASYGLWKLNSWLKTKKEETAKTEAKLKTPDNENKKKESDKTKAKNYFSNMFAKLKMKTIGFGVRSIGVINTSAIVGFTYAATLLKKSYTKFRERSNGRNNFYKTMASFSTIRNNTAKQHIDSCAKLSGLSKCLGINEFIPQHQKQQLVRLNRKNQQKNSWGNQVNLNQPRQTGKRPRAQVVRGGYTGIPPGGYYYPL